MSHSLVVTILNIVKKGLSLIARLNSNGQGLAEQSHRPIHRPGTRA